MRQQRHQWKIHQDEIKTRQTSHWDLDYLPAAEYEALMAGQRDRDQALQRRQRLIRAAAVGATLAVAALAGLVVL